MKFLFIHGDIKFNTTKKAINNPDEELSGEAVNALVVFTAVEEGDDNISENAVLEIENVLDKVKAERIVVYPYAHLSSNLAKPEVGRKILNEIYEKLRGKHETIKAPFGWYKSFELKCKGHPLSELSKTITSAEKKELKEAEQKAPEKKEEKKEIVSEALKSEEKIKSKIYILSGSSGTLIEPDKFDFKGHENLKKFYHYETAGTRKVDIPPPHVKFMRDYEIADYEGGSDKGNLRFYPKGKLIKTLIEEHVQDKLVDYGAMVVETPLMYDYKHKALEKYLNRFPARQYTVKSGDDEFFLRFSACFGQFLMKSSMTISYKSLPIKLYELSKSFRREQEGELVGLKRLRAFTMPDMHTLCMDVEQAKAAFIEQYQMSREVMKDLNLNYEVAIRVVKSFYDENREFIEKLAEIADKPVIVEVWNERFFYFILKFEFNFVDFQGKASALSTVQIDVENAERFEIQYVDSEGKKKFPLILHSSISGAIERDIYALLEKAAIDIESKKKASFPLWLSPTQLRIIPVSEKQVDYCRKFEISDVRVDIDDRNESLGKKIMEANKEWIPYIAVVGDKEVENDVLSVTVRESGEKKEYKFTELIKEIKEKTEGVPYRKLTIPVYLSKRAIFV